MTSLLTVCISVRFHDSLSDNKLTNYGRDMSGVIAIADALKSGTAVLKKLDVRYASLGRAEQLLRDAVAGRDGFELLV